MATLKGAIRSYNASVRRMERDQQRRNREATRLYKAQLKQEMLHNAAEAVKNWENYVEMIQSVHKDCPENVDWNEIKNAAPPQEPELSDTHEAAARWEWVSYTPSVWDKLFGRTNKKRAALEQKIAEAKEKDRQEFKEAQERYDSDLLQWKELKEIAEGVLNKDPEAYLKALQFFQPFSDVSALGSRVAFSMQEDFVDVELHVNSNEVIPDYVLSLTSTGKLSRKNMPKGRFFEIYQDHVCSAVLRVACEGFALLPVDSIRVTALASTVNPETGHLEDRPILSVWFVPETLQRINLQAVDPSDCVTGNFLHTMKFRKTAGFVGVEKVEIKN